IASSNLRSSFRSHRFFRALHYVFGRIGGAGSQPRLNVHRTPGATVRSQQNAYWKAVRLLHSPELRPATDYAKAPQILEAQQFEGQFLPPSLEKDGSVHKLPKANSLSC